jgi:hypothetical protein
MDEYTDMSATNKYENEHAVLCNNASRKTHALGIAKPPNQTPTPNTHPHHYQHALPNTHTQAIVTSSSSLHIRRRQRLHHTRAIHKPRAENPVRVRKHAVLQTDDDELAAAEARADQPADVLRVREVEGRVDFVEDVHGRGRVLEEGEDEGEGD